MFLQIEELKSVMYAYQLEEITEADDDISYMAIISATDKVKSYLRPNRKKNWQDGRPKYDVEKVFSATGTDRNALILEMVKNIAAFNLVKLCNVDMLLEKYKDIYDRDIAFLKEVKSGENTLDLPLLDESEEPEATKAFRCGSRPKFNYE